MGVEKSSIWIYMIATPTKQDTVSPNQFRCTRDPGLPGTIMNHSKQTALVPSRIHIKLSYSYRGCIPFWTLTLLILTVLGVFSEMSYSSTLTAVLSSFVESGYGTPHRPLCGLLTIPFNWETQGLTCERWKQQCCSLSPCYAKIREASPALQAETAFLQQSSAQATRRGRRPTTLAIDQRIFDHVWWSQPHPLHDQGV